MNSTILADKSVSLRGIQVERRNSELGTREECPVSIRKHVIADRKGFHQDFADRNNAGEEPIVSLQHSAAQIFYYGAERRTAFQQINEEVRVPKDVRHVNS